MSIQAAGSEPNWGSFALVTYLPDPLSSFLTELRQFLPGDNRPEAHITFLPPRPLRLPLNAASNTITHLLGGVKPFEVELGVVSVFPGTNMLHLGIENGKEALINLHACLNSGSLFDDELFEYIPHLTLSGPLSESELPGALVRADNAWDASKHSRRFVVSDAVLLWQPGGSLEGDWERVSTYPFWELMRGNSTAAAVQI